MATEKSIKVIDEKKQLSNVEFRQHRLSDHSQLIVVNDESGPLLWLRLQPGESINSACIDEQITQNPWVQMRIGQFAPLEKPVYFIQKTETEELQFVELIPSRDKKKAMSANSENAGLSAIHSSSQDLQDGEPNEITRQKAEAREILNRVIAAKLNAGQCTSLQEITNGGAIYHFVVDGEIEEASSIPGISNTPYAKGQFDPSSKRNTEHLTTSNKIPLYRQGEDLLVLVRDDELIYISPRYGKARVLANTSAELPLTVSGSGTQSLKGLIIDATNLLPVQKKELHQRPTTESARQKVRKYFDHILLSQTVSIIGEPPMIQGPSGSLEERKRKAVRKLCPGGKITRSAELVLGQYDHLLSLCTQHHISQLSTRKSDNEKYNYVIGMLNDNVPEVEIEQLLNNLPEGTISIYQFIPLISSLEAVANLEKLATEAVHAISLWYFAIVFAYTHLDLYRQEVTRYLTELPDFKELELIAEGQNMPLAQTRNTISKMLGATTTEPNAGGNAAAVEAMKVYYHSELYPPRPEVYASLGPIAKVDTIPTTKPPFSIFKEYIVVYPEKVIQALRELIVEYNHAFSELLPGHLENENDYRYCKVGNSYINRFIQVDMTALTDEFLHASEHLSAEEIKEYLRRNIFEMENNLAMYNMMRLLFDGIHGEVSPFHRNFDAALERVRKETGKKIAVVAFTRQKYVAMAQTEFGMPITFSETDTVNQEQVRELSGFDAFWGPEQFKHMVTTGEIRDWVIYSRTSLPTDHLKSPSSRESVAPEIFNDPKMLAAARAVTIMMNIDNPNCEISRTLNDTKRWAEKMGCGVLIKSIGDLEGTTVSDYLNACGIPLEHHKEVYVRCKPAGVSYGAYGHLRGKLGNMELLRELGSQIKERGPYVLQLEISPTVFVNTASSEREKYMAIHRVFFAVTGEQPKDVNLIAGFVNTLRENDPEVSKGNIHGQDDAVWALITSQQDMDLI